MEKFVFKIKEELTSYPNVKKIEVHSFNSGAFMIDVWTEKDFYCIQLFDNKFGLSKIDNNTIGFDTIPDKTYDSWEKFFSSLRSIKKKKRWFNFLNL